jgi:hypothetical protein
MPSGAPTPCSRYSVTTSPASRQITMRATPRNSATSVGVVAAAFKLFRYMGDTSQDMRYVAGYSPPAGRRWRGERSGSWSKVRAHSKGQLLNSRCFSRRPAAIPSGLSAGRRPASSRPAGSSRSGPWSRTRPCASRRGPGCRLLPAAAHSLRFGRSIFFLQSARLVRASSLAGSIATAFSKNVRASFSLPASKSEYPRSFASS